MAQKLTDLVTTRLGNGRLRPGGGSPPAGPPTRFALRVRVVSSLRMPSIAREAPDPKLDLRYPAHWGRAGHNSLYPYRPLAAFTDRLAEEERRRAAEADKRAWALEQDKRRLARAEWWLPQHALELQRMLGWRKAADGRNGHGGLHSRCG